MASSSAASTMVREDFGEAKYVLSQCLKLSLLSVESRLHPGRHYIYRKTKDRQNSTGGTYWRCTQCEDKIRHQGGRVTENGEMAGRMVVVNNRLLSNPETTHHSECRGVDGAEVLRKQMDRQQRLLTGVKRRRRRRSRLSNSDAAKRQKTNCSEQPQITQKMAHDLLNAVVKTEKEEEEEPQTSSYGANQSVTISAISRLDEDHVIGNGGEQQVDIDFDRWAMPGGYYEPLPVVQHGASMINAGGVMGSSSTVQQPRVGGRWLLYFSPRENVLSVCNEKDEIFKILENRLKHSDSSSSNVGQIFQSPNFDARLLLPEMYEYLMKILNKNFFSYNSAVATASNSNWPPDVGGSGDSEEIR